jgi:hypothetical protein
VLLGSVRECFLTGVARSWDNCEDANYEVPHTNLQMKNRPLNSDVTGKMETPKNKDIKKQAEL